MKIGPKMKILVTGGAGFVGSNFIRYMLKKYPEYEVVNLDKLTYCGNLDNIKDVQGDHRYSFIKGDIKEIDVVKRAMEDCDVVINFAAESITGDAYLPVWTALGIRIYSFEDLYRNLSRRNKVKVCNKKIETIDLDNKNIKVLAYKGGIGYWMPVKQISRHRYKGKIIHLHQKWGEVEATPNHSIYDVNFEITSPKTNPELLGLRNINHISKKQKYKSYRGKKLRALVSILAAYVSEGWSSFDKANGSHQVGIANKNKNWIDFLKNSFRILGYNPSITKTKRNLYQLVISNKEFFTFIRKEACYGHHDKKIPDFIFNLEKSYQEDFLRNIVRGDGEIIKNKNYKTIRYVTTSKRLATGLSLLLTLLKYNYSVVKDKRFNAYSLNFGGDYTISLLDKNYEEKDYEGYVYDVSVEGLHNFVCGVGNIVVHNSHVDRSIKKPNYFIKTNVHGVLTLLKVARDVKISKFVQISCYDEKTRALTTEGLKTYKELKKGDMVFSLNPKTFEIEVKPVEKVIIQSYKGEMIHFNNQRVDLFVTPNHNMFILDTTKKKLLVECAKDACQRSIFYMPEGHWTGSDEEYFDIKGHGKVNIKDLMYILGIYIGDGFTAYQEKEVETRTGLAREEYLKKSRDITTGRFKKIEKQGSYKTTCRSYRIFFDIPEDDKCRRKVEKHLRALGVRYHSHKGKAGTHLYFTSKAFTSLFNQCGIHAHNKHIPRWALEYSPKYLRYLLRGLMDSDGSKGKIYYTVSERLASNICELCIKLNLKPTIRKKHSISFFQGRKIEGTSYYVFVANSIKSISRHRHRVMNYNGDIWCLKVKDNKNFIVERNGKLNFCGNTDEVYGSIEKGSFSEKSNLNPRSPYSASKAGADLLALAFFTTYKLPVLVTRSCNNFGPYQYPEKLLPLFITNALEDKKLPLYADGMNVRDWLYVLDNCEAIDLVLHNGKIGAVYNVSGANEITNIELTHKILKYLGKSEDLIQFVEDRPGHDRRYSLDCAKIKVLGWKPRHDFETALKETIDWYKENRHWWEPLKKSAEYTKVTRHKEIES